MDFKLLLERGLEIRRRYEAVEQARYGRSWTDEELALGFVGMFATVLVDAYAIDLEKHLESG